MNTRITIELANIQLLTICGEIHLALKHPENEGPSALMAKQILKQFLIALFNQGMTIPADVLAGYEEIIGPLIIPSEDLVTEPEFEAYK